MGRQEIVGRILSDAEAEAQAIIDEAESKARETVEAAQRRALRDRQGSQAEAKAKADSVKEGRAAAARLDTAKIRLAERRRVIDVIYTRALGKLLSLDEKDSLMLAESLITSYAESGDCIVFAENYAFAEAVAKSQAVKKLNLKISDGRIKLDGGFILKGEKSDKDVSYGALLAQDREERQSEIAAEVFKADN